MFKILTVNQPLNYLLHFLAQFSTSFLENRKTQTTLSNLMGKVQMFNRDKKSPLYSSLPVSVSPLCDNYELFSTSVFLVTPQPHFAGNPKTLV